MGIVVGIALLVLGIVVALSGRPRRADLERDSELTSGKGFRPDPPGAMLIVGGAVALIGLVVIVLQL